MLQWPGWLTWLSRLDAEFSLLKIEAFLVDADDLEMDKTLTLGAGLAVITDGFKNTEKELI